MEWEDRLSAAALQHGLKLRSRARQSLCIADSNLGTAMFMWDAEGDFGRLLLGVFISLMIGAACGAPALIVGLIRGHKQMGWTGFAVCVLFGLGCWYIALLPAIVFTIIVAVTKPIEKRKKKKGPKRRRRRQLAEDFLDDQDDYHDRQRRRKRAEEKLEYGDEDDEDEDEDDRRPRRRRREEDDEDDRRPRRRARRRDDDD